MESVRIQAKTWHKRKGSVGDPQGILGGSVPKTGDPVGFAPMFCGGSLATNIPFYNIKRGKGGNKVLEVRWQDGAPDARMLLYPVPLLLELYKDLLASSVPYLAQARPHGF